MTPAAGAAGGGAAGRQADDVRSPGPARPPPAIRCPARRRSARRAGRSPARWRTPAPVRHPGRRRPATAAGDQRPGTGPCRGRPRRRAGPVRRRRPAERRCGSRRRRRRSAVGAARVTEAVAPRARTVASAAARGPRRARLNLKRIDPWSVMKFSFAVSRGALHRRRSSRPRCSTWRWTRWVSSRRVNNSLGDLISASGGAERRARLPDHRQGRHRHVGAASARSTWCCSPRWPRWARSSTTSAPTWSAASS